MPRGAAADVTAALALSAVRSGRRPGPRPARSGRQAPRGRAIATRGPGRGAAVAAVLTLAVCGAARADDTGGAQVAREEVRHYRVLANLLNRTGDRSSLFARLAACRYRHSYGKDIAPGIWIDRETVIDFAQLDIARHRVEDRDGDSVKMMIVPLRDGVPPVSHSLALTDMKGTMQKSFTDRYGGRCEGIHCDATRTDRQVYIAVVGDRAPTDINTVATAVIGLAQHCATAASKGD